MSDTGLVEEEEVAVTHTGKWDKLIKWDKCKNLTFTSGSHSAQRHLPNAVSVNVNKHVLGTCHELLQHTIQKEE